MCALNCLSAFNHIARLCIVIDLNSFLLPFRSQSVNPDKTNAGCTLYRHHSEHTRLVRRGKLEGFFRQASRVSQVKHLTHNKYKLYCWSRNCYYKSNSSLLLEQAESIENCILPRHIEEYANQILYSYQGLNIVIFKGIVVTIKHGMFLAWTRFRQIRAASN